MPNRGSVSQGLSGVKLVNRREALTVLMIAITGGDTTNGYTGIFQLGVAL